MGRPKKKKSRGEVSEKIRASRHLNPLRTGMPALDSIVDVKEFKKGKKVYRLIQTNEVDEYERPVSKTKRKK
jgi:hypothetical protein